MKSAITKKHVSLFKKFTVASVMALAVVGCAVDEQYTFESSYQTASPEKIVVAHGFTISKDSAVVSENGTIVDNFNVVLNSEPAKNVSISLNHGGSDEVKLNPTNLLFDSTNWMTPQTVILTGEDDIHDDDNQTSTISITLGSLDANYNLGLSSTNVNVTTIDDDLPAGFTISRNSAVVSEDGTVVDNFTVVLNSEPAANVSFSLSNGGSDEVTVHPPTLTFGSGDWMTPQTVFLTGIDDADDDDNQTSVIDLRLASADTNYNMGLSSQTLTVMTIDDDLPECSWSGGGDFDSGTPNLGNPIIPGWTFNPDQIRIGIDSIAGLPTPQDDTQNPPTPKGTVSNYDRNLSNRYTSQASDITTNTFDGSAYAVKMSSSNSYSTYGCDIIHGPYIYSNTNMQLNQGDTVEFDWEAEGTGDWYDVFGYIIDVNDNYSEVILNSTGINSPWSTASRVINRDGTYKFVFVSGTFDYSCGKMIGGTLNIDNIRVKTSNQSTCQ